MTKLKVNLKPHAEMKNKTKFKIEENNNLDICIYKSCIFHIQKEKMGWTISRCRNICLSSLP